MKQVFERAAMSKGNVEIIYMSSNRQFTKRIIKVLSISNTVIQAYCYQKHSFRTFKIENVLSASPVPSIKSGSLR
ncbi:hypothetical protein [Siminovitchia fortis]|uniref:WYL domain-containing protein n=1 Tax=Siminovitchia fortis TaxID=254758 RepID=A0A443IU08_9BACI|nr:hypothetical protein [Siminovitchia fortis]RWR11183.1 hypothetical protein D4N35_008625 [Siminovitchia fortis]WHY80403.1 hypothetical protein QNH23_10605 [Siminovitchia fortis]